MHNTDTERGRGDTPSRPPAEPAMTSAHGDGLRQPLVQLVSGSATFSRNGTSSTSGRHIDRDPAGGETTLDVLLTVLASNARAPHTWTTIQALPTLRESPLRASDLRGHNYGHHQRHTADSTDTDAGANAAPPRTTQRAKLEHNREGRPRAKNSGPAAALKFILVMVSVALIAASLVLISWSLLQQSAAGPDSRVDLDATDITTINR